MGKKTRRNYTDLLLTDFSSSYEQLRHYDNQINDIFKFVITFYTSIIAGAVALYNIVKISGDNFLLLIKYAAVAIFIFGFLTQLIIIRNRKYFVKVARYLNELRDLAMIDSQFTNKSKMYTSHENPKHFDSLSSHSILIYLCTILNSAIATLAIYLFFNSSLLINCIFAIIFILIQLSINIVYLKHFDR